MALMDEMLAQIQQPTQQQPSGNMMDSMLASINQPTSPTGGGNTMDAMLASLNQPAIPDNTEKTIGDIAADIGGALMKPASAALEAISYFDKPRGAIAGTVKAAQEGTDLWEGAKSGWQNNTSWKETFSPEFVKENPTTASVLGFVADVAGDPLWFTAPAKVAKVLKMPEAAGYARKALESTDAGRSMLAKAEDFVGVNRVADPLADFKAGRATDQVLGQDVVDEINAFKKANPDQAENITRYVEAADRTGNNFNVIGQDVLDALDNGTLAKEIKAGNISKDQAFDAIRNTGREIPDYLLQTHQGQELTERAQAIKQLKLDVKSAQEAGDTALEQQLKQALAHEQRNINNVSDYVYRDEVLAAIPDTGIRAQVQAIGDKIAKINEKYSNKLLATGRLSDEQYVHFMGGSHLRRSFAQYEKPEEFLAAVKKNGTNDEWQRVYADYQTMKNANTFGGAHKVNMKDFVGRQVLSDETMAKMGLINDPAYKVMDTFNRGSKALREDEFLTKVDQMFGKSKEEAALLSRNLPKSREYVPVPEGKAYGALSGKWVPRDVANQVMGALGQKPDKLNETLGKVVSWWKVGKLANPASIMRNFYSGLPMANVFGQVPLYALPKAMAKVTQQFASAGKNAPLIRELRETGILGNIWNKQELANIIGENPKGIKKLADMGMEAFGAPDKFWRAVTYAYHRDAGKSIKEAAAIANKALFDYSQAPEWVNWLSRSGVMPFAKFPYFAAKETGRALWNNPAQVTKYTKAQNQVNTSDREQIMPDYLRAKTLLPTGEQTRMVNGKPQKVQGNIDLSYILPFANDVSVGNPAFEAWRLLSTGKNGLGQDIIKPGMTGQEKILAGGKQLLNSALPTVFSPYTAERLYNGYQGNVDSKGRQYDFWDAVKQTGLGIKNVPVNIDELYQQKMAKFKRDQNDIQAMMRQIVRDQSMPSDQKREQLVDHQRQLKNLAIEARKTQQAYVREKKRGGE